MHYSIIAAYSTNILAFDIANKLSEHEKIIQFLWNEKKILEFKVKNLEDEVHQLKSSDVWRHLGHHDDRLDDVDNELESIKVTQERLRREKVLPIIVICV